MSINNPLLQDQQFPLFDQIQPLHIEPALDVVLNENRSALQQQLSDLSLVDWQGLITPLEEREDRLSKLWSPIGHLHGVMNSPELREAYQAALEKLTAYSSEMGQNSELYKAYKALAERSDFADLSQAQQQSVKHALRNFELAGVALSEDKKQRYTDISKRLSELSTHFSNNVLDATQGWYYQISDASRLAGLPEHAIALAKQAAEQKKVDGYVFTLDIPSYLAVMTYADDRELRAQVYRAYCTRASSAAEDAQWDNSDNIKEILTLKHEKAQLLGFDNFAELSLATKMADDPKQVVGFLEDLANKSKPAAAKELAELKAFAEQEHGVTDLAAWDLSYYGEKLKQQQFDISDNELRPYFPIETVINGMFQVVEKLFSIQVQAVDHMPKWHDDARTYVIKRNDKAIAYFYLDPFARENKRGGAWMDECRVRRIRIEEDGQALQLPVAYLVCNFTPPVGDTPSLLTHNEVTTLFHEFGHGLHHMLTKIDVAAVSGINGVAWDAVELPSQFLENWCWQPEVIPMISGHHETGEPLPQALLDKMLAAKNFQSAMQMLRQLEFALFDFKLHWKYNAENPVPVHDVLQAVRQQVSVFMPPVFNTFENSFSHIFAGGYAAGYYSYKWAEVLSADAFSLFEEKGIFDPATGEKFLHEILQKGGSQEPAVLFENFRGRQPSVDALLRHSGIEV